MVRRLTPASIVYNVAILLVKKRAKGPAGQDEVEAGVDLLILPEVRPDMAPRVGVMERLQIATGLSWSLDRAYRAFTPRVVQVAINTKKDVRILLKDAVSVLAQ